MAKQSSDEKSFTGKNTNRYKAERGVAPGPARFGYMYSREKKQWLQDPSQSAAIEHIFQVYDDNQYSLSDMCELLNSEGLRTATGNRWTTTTLHQILTNIFYTGSFLYQGEVWPGTHEPYISMERYRARLDRLSVKYVGAKKRSTDHILSGFAKFCGRVLTGEQKQGRWTYYTNRAMRASYREEAIIEMIDRRIEQIEFNEEFAGLLKSSIKEIITERTRNQGAREGAVEREIQKYRTKKLKLLDLYTEEDIDKDLLREKINEYSGVLDRLEREKRSVRVDADKFILSAVEVVETLKRFPATYRHLENRDKIDFLKIYADHVDINEKEGLYIAWKEPFNFIFCEEILAFKDVPVRNYPAMRAQTDTVRTPGVRQDDFRTAVSRRVDLWIMAA